MNIHMCNCHLDDLMGKQYSIENLGVLNKDDNLLSFNDKNGFKILDKQIPGWMLLN